MINNGVLLPTMITPGRARAGSPASGPASARCRARRAPGETEFMCVYMYICTHMCICIYRERKMSD